MSGAEPRPAPQGDRESVPVEPLVSRNDWSVLRPPAVGDWQPVSSVSVVVPAHGRQAELDLMLASLSCQSYPAHLLEVIVVDDGSEPPLTLPAIHPDNASLIRADDGGWGCGWARHSGAKRADGDVLMFLDSDLVLLEHHIEAQLRWHHLVSYAVTVGQLDFVPAALFEQLTPAAVHQAASRGEVGQLFPPDVAEGTPWLESLFGRTAQLTQAGHNAFRAHVGASSAMPRALYHDTGGLDLTLVLGEDTELGYRLGQQGAVFVPEPASRAWHPGLAAAVATGAAVARHDEPYFAQRIPLMALQRRAPARRWQVPLIEVVVDATEESYRTVQSTVDRVLAGDLDDLRISLVGPWSSLDADRYASGGEVDGMSWLAEYYRTEARVALVDAVADSAFPIPFRLELPADCAPGYMSVRSMMSRLRKDDLGLLQALVEANGQSSRVVRLLRTAAVERARRLTGGTSLDDVVDRVWGSVWVDGGVMGLRLHTGETGDEPLRAWRGTQRSLAAAREQLREAEEALTEARRTVKRMSRRIERLRAERAQLRALSTPTLRRLLSTYARRLRRRSPPVARPAESPKS